MHIDEAIMATTMAGDAVMRANETIVDAWKSTTRRGFFGGRVVRRKHSLAEMREPALEAIRQIEVATELLRGVAEADRITGAARLGEAAGQHARQALGELTDRGFGLSLRHHISRAASGDTIDAWHSRYEVTVLDYLRDAAPAVRRHAEALSVERDLTAIDAAARSHAAAIRELAADAAGRAVQLVREAEEVASYAG